LKVATDFYSFRPFFWADKNLRNLHTAALDNRNLLVILFLKDKGGQIGQKEVIHAQDKTGISFEVGRRL
jgi:hypothetical protein